MSDTKSLKMNYSTWIPHTDVSPPQQCPRPSRTLSSGQPLSHEMTILPKSRGEAMHNFANNFPVGTTRNRAMLLITPNAIAAWRHHYGYIAYRFAWNNHKWHGPKATLCVVSNGPHFFAKEWLRLFINEVVAQSRIFSNLSSDVLRLIVDNLK